MYSVVLPFEDPAVVSVFKKIWFGLAEQQVCSRQKDLDYFPHLTLSTQNKTPSDSSICQLSELFLAQEKAFTLNFRGLTLLTNGNPESENASSVLLFRPERCSDLFTLQEKVYEIFPSSRDYDEPSRWTGHVTGGVNFKPCLVPTVAKIAQDSWVPFKIIPDHAVIIHVAAGRPVEEVAKFPFSTLGHS